MTIKIQCMRCKEIVDIGPFRVDDSGIHVTCGACAEQYYVPSGSEDARDAQRVPAASIDGQAMTCPKCELAQAEADACVQCGLRADRFGDYAGTPDDHDQALAAMFAACEASWNDDEAHERFVAAVSASTSFAYGARRYRGVLRERPADARAKKQLERLARMAEVKLLTASVVRTTEEEVKEPYKAVVILIIILVLALAAGGYYVMSLKNRRAKSDEASPPTTPPSLRDNTRPQPKRRGINKASQPGATPAPRQPEKR